MVGKYNEHGLTVKEQKALDGLRDAVEAFNKLDMQHPDERRDFIDGVHKCQDALLTRVVRRSYPKGWPTYAETSSGVWNRVSPEEGVYGG